MNDIRLIHGDCLEVMKTFADGEFDAVVTDPPYGINENSTKNNARGQLAKPRDYGEYHWDTKRLDSIFFEEMRRVSKHQIIFGGNFYTDYLAPSSSWIVWDKLNTGDFADCELIWTSHKTAVRKFEWMWNGFIKQRPEQRYHPTQKPIAVIQFLLEQFTQPSDYILDPFGGSGTTAVACHRLGRRCTSIEIEKTYHDISVKRVTEAQMQPRLM